jgi:hypothetical protein
MEAECLDNPLAIVHHHHHQHHLRYLDRKIHVRIG